MSAPIMPKIAAYIAAAPGFFIIETVFYDGDDSIEIYRRPVIGWAIDANEYCVYSITPDGIHWRTSPYLLQPDGTVDRPSIDGYANLEDWMKAMQREHTSPKHKGL